MFLASGVGKAGSFNLLLMRAKIDSPRAVEYLRELLYLEELLHDLELLYPGVLKRLEIRHIII